MDTTSSSVISAAGTILHQPFPMRRWPGSRKTFGIVDKNNIARRSARFSCRSCAVLMIMLAPSQMPNLHTAEGAMFLMRIFASAFLAILFLQSGIDKVVDRQGNLEWLKGHFAKSPLAGVVPLLVTAVHILEITAGALSAVGCAMIIFSRDSTLAFYGAILSAISIIALFFGQRMAKEYPG